jgi:hypothetical protein
MKTIKNIGLLALVLLFAVTSCKKENDFGGTAKIKGVITVNDKPVANAIARIAFNAKEKTTTFNGSTISDMDGNYEFAGLLRGDYYVTAEYTNSAGMKFTTGGAHVTIGDKKGTVQVDLKLE